MCLPGRLVVVRATRDTNLPSSDRCAPTTTIVSACCQTGTGTLGGASLCSGGTSLLRDSCARWIRSAPAPDSFVAGTVGQLIRRYHSPIKATSSTRVHELRNTSLMTGTRSSVTTASRDMGIHTRGESAVNAFHNCSAVALTFNSETL